MMVTTGTRVPGEGKNVVRGESVALMLMGAAVLPGKKEESSDQLIVQEWCQCLQVEKAASRILCVVSCDAPIREHL